MNNEPDQYRITATSNKTSATDYIRLSESPKGLTRRVLQIDIVDNQKDSSQPLRATVLHQRRSNSDDDWAPFDTSSLATTRANDVSTFKLNAQATARLYDALRRMYKHYSIARVHEQEVVVAAGDASELIILDSDQGQLIRSLLSEDLAFEFWKGLQRDNSTLARRLARLERLEESRETLREFEMSLTQEPNESYWQKLLEDHPWLIGHHQTEVISERRIDTENYSDLPLKVAGGFLHIVELKTPSAPFWLHKTDGRLFRYRDKFLVPDRQVEEAIAQVAGYIAQSEKQVDSVDFIRTRGVVPLKPSGSIVVGRSHEWKDEQWRSWQMLNHRLHGIEVLTFDHLYDRARRTVDTFDRD